mgnify:CR=1 FL=1
MIIDIDEVLQLHETTVTKWHTSEIENPFDEALSIVCDQHSDNFRLWHEEDSARCPTTNDIEIAAVKRRIDKLNQSRNDRIEKIDEWISEVLEQRGIEPKENARLNTETPGSAIDRLSIMALRLYHLDEQLQRDDATPDHRVSVNEKISICKMQKLRLSQALKDLLDEIEQGRCQHVTYRQFKMYNDKNLNPYLYKKQADG